MSPLITRRTALAGAAALPFLRGTARAATPGTLVFGLSSYPPTIQPWANSGTAAATVKLMIHRGLMSYGPDGALRPELAESFTREGDTVWIFKLREAKFQNGDPVTAADVKWTLEQVAAEKGGAYLRPQAETIASIDTPDDRTVRITTKLPVATLLDWMASYHLPIICRNSPRGQFVGAGPFTITAQERGTSIDLAAFDGYYRPGLPKLKRLRVVAYADENARTAALQAGDVDLIEYVPWQSMDAITANPQLKLQTVDGPFMYLLFNGSRPPFDDPRVRKAVAHAIRREDLVKAVFYGRGTTLTQLPISPASAYYNPDYKDGWAYDPALAKKLLADAGHSGGIESSLLSTAQYGMHKDTAEIVQQHLAAVGIKVQLNLPDWATRVTLGNRGQFDMAVQGTSAESNDPDGIANFVDGSPPPAYIRSYGIKTDRITALFAAGRAEFDEAKRKAIYKELEGVAIEQAPMVGLTWRSQGYAMGKDVTGFTNMPGALTFYSGMTLETTAVG